MGSTRRAASAGSSALGPFGSTTVGRSWLCGARLASTSTGWPRMRPGGLTPRSLLRAGVAARQVGPQSAVHTHQTGDSDDDPMFGCILDADIPEFEPPHRVLEWPVVPTGDFAPGTFNRRDYYLARLGPWARVVHSLAAKGRRTRSPGAGVASSATERSPWFGPRRPPNWAGYRGSGVANAGPAGASAAATTRTTSYLSWSRGALRALARTAGPGESSAGFGKRPSRPWVLSSLVRTAFAPTLSPPLSQARAPPSHLLVAAPPGTMAAPHAAQTLIDFDTLAAEAGAGEVVLNYLWARGLARTATLALVEPTEARFRATVIDPLASTRPPTQSSKSPRATSRPSRRSSYTCTWRPGRSGTPGRPPEPQLFAPRPHRRPPAQRHDAQPAVAAGGPAAQVL